MQQNKFSNRQAEFDIKATVRDALNGPRTLEGCEWREKGSVYRKVLGTAEPLSAFRCSGQWWWDESSCWATAHHRAPKLGLCKAGTSPAGRHIPAPSLGKWIPDFHVDKTSLLTSIHLHDTMGTYSCSSLISCVLAAPQTFTQHLISSHVQSSHSSLRTRSATDIPTQSSPACSATLDYARDCLKRPTTAQHASIIRSHGVRLRLQSRRHS